MPRAYRIDPQVAHERAKKASAARDNVDNTIKRLVASAPPLTDQQRAALAGLLRTAPAPESAPDDGSAVA
ncbi:hypothetical protein [Streptomyces sp. NPDC007172]|uniref:hypothetical protein n=1 Tax=Streptomyces sp. NPDC007172 TaxID=3364776 RepID=UPI003680F38D